MRSKSYYSFGSTLHNVLQKFYAEDGGVKTTEEAIVAFEEGWIEEGYSTPEEMALAFGEGRQIIEAHVEQAMQSPRAARTFMVERQLRLDLGDWVLIGRIDRVDEHPDGTLEIVDYKSQREDVTSEDVATSLAMCCYQLLLKRKFPERKVYATIHALRTNRQASAHLTEEELLAYEADLLTLGNDILSRDFQEAEPICKPLCAYCDFRTLCRQHPDFDEAFRAQFETGTN